LIEIEENTPLAACFFYGHFESILILGKELGARTIPKNIPKKIDCHKIVS